MFFVLFSLFSVPCNIISCFIILPFTPKIIVKSFFYFLLTSLEVAKAVMNYSRLSVLRTDVVCVLFWSIEKMRSNHIFTVVYSRAILKKKNFVILSLVLRNPLHRRKTSKRCSSDSKLLFFQDFHFSKGGGIVQIFLI